MKIVKILSFIFVLSLIICAFASCNKEPKYEELKLLKTEIITCKNNSCKIAGIIDYENANVSENDPISANSTAESIVKFEDNKLVFGNEYGEATIDLIVGNKKGTVNVKVVPCTDYLYARTTEDDATGYDQLDYYASIWLINNLGNFKNPSSVSVEDVLYVEDTVDSDNFNASYVIMEIRGQNSFGGYVLEHYKVSVGKIEVANVKYSYDGLFKYYNDQRIYTRGAYLVQEAVKEYISENY